MTTKIAKQRNISYDILRILLCICVIAIHTRPVELQNYKYFNAILPPIIYLCNPLFFMISGRFNLCKSFENKKDIIDFYKKRIIQIIIPWLFYSFLLYVWNIVKLNSYNGMKNFIIEFVKKFISNNISYHLWFMYALLGMLISTPFLSIMLKGMSKGQKKLLFYIATVWMICTGTIPNFGVEFAGNNFLLGGWIYFYFAGWYLTQTNNGVKEGRYTFLWIAGIAYFTTVIITLCYPSYAHNVDWALPYIVFVFAIYKFAISNFNVSRIKIRQLIYFLSKRVFSVYMIHVIVIDQIAQWNFIASMNAVVRYLFVIAVVYIVSVILGIILDKIIDIVINGLLLRQKSVGIDKNGNS